MTASTRPHVAPVHDDTRHGLSSRSIRHGFRDHLLHGLGRRPESAGPEEAYLALAYTVRDRLIERWLRTAETYQATRARTVCYLSPEYLPGPHLGNTLLALGIWEPAQRAMEKLGYDLETILAQEPEPGLGNGELGRLASCFMDSLATLGIPAVGYGIRYEFGAFLQEIRDGWQVEVADQWLRAGNPWEMPRPELVFPVGFDGRSTFVENARGRTHARWSPARFVQGVAYDTPVPGHGVGNVNRLRLWKAQAAEAFDPQAFHAGDYVGAVLDKCASETISKVLYPSDEPPAGKHLLLEQQYFLVSCSLQDILRTHREAGLDPAHLHRHVAVQLHDAHAALAVPELMRLLVDEHGMDWNRAWEVVVGTFATTSHALPEAVPSWPVELLGRLLPRHLEILYEVNHRFLETAAQRRPAEADLPRRLSLIEEAPERRVRLLHVACVGSHGVNGTAAQHTDRLREDLLHDWEGVWPGKIRNVTHGVTPRRFLLLANPGLSRLITDAIGDGWVRDLGKLRDLEPLSGDATFQDAWRAAKRRHRESLAAETGLRSGVQIDPESFMDAQADRFHESKRQLLNLLHVITLVHRIRRDPDRAWPPRTVLFAGRAAPGNETAQRILKLVHGVSGVVNADPEVRARLRVAFLPGHTVKNGGRLYAGADLAQQIATGGQEAGTDGMKFALNGALTIGSPDGVNPEIRRAVGPEHYFQFGSTVDGTRQLIDRGYRPRDRYENDAELREALDCLADGTFVEGDRALMEDLVQHLLAHDPWLVLADYRAYVEAHEEAARLWRDPERWTRASILTVSRMGAFSSDRAVQEYAAQIWHVNPVPVSIADGEAPAPGA